MRHLRRSLLAGITCAALLSGCSMPHYLGLGSYYAITEVGTGRVYYSESLRHEKRAVVEFRDAQSGAWVSLPQAEVREISKAEFTTGLGQ